MSNQKIDERLRQTPKLVGWAYMVMLMTLAITFFCLVDVTPPLSNDLYVDEHLWTKVLIGVVSLASSGIISALLYIGHRLPSQ